MQRNLLDELFKSQLKEQNELPQDITFNKERVFNSLEKRINTKTSGRRWMAYAVLIILLFSSAYWHWEQSNTIAEQQYLLSQHQEEVNSVMDQTKKQLVAQQSIIDSLVNQTIKHSRYNNAVQLSSLPAVVVSHQVAFAPVATINISQPIYISEISNPENSKSKLPELDLPVYYESERLTANYMDASKTKRLGQKLKNLLNN